MSTFIDNPKIGCSIAFAMFVGMLALMVMTVNTLAGTPTISCSRLVIPEQFTGAAVVAYNNHRYIVEYDGQYFELDLETTDCNYDAN